MSPNSMNKWKKCEAQSTIKHTPSVNAPFWICSFAHLVKCPQINDDRTCYRAVRYFNFNVWQCTSDSVLHKKASCFYVVKTNFMDEEFLGNGLKIWVSPKQTNFSEFLFIQLGPGWHCPNSKLSEWNHPTVVSFTCEKKWNFKHQQKKQKTLNPKPPIFFHYYL